MLYYLGRCLFRLLFQVLGRWQVSGREHCPVTGPVILAPNHISYLDPPASGSGLHRPVHFMAKEELFRIPILGWVLPRVHAFPVRRGTADRAALRRAEQLLAQGEIVVIFPEGTRSPDGRLQSPELGIAFVALRSRAPVLPCLLTGTNRMLPGDSPFIRPAKITIHYGQPLTFPDLYGQPLTRGVLQQTADRVMTALRVLLS